MPSLLVGTTVPASTSGSSKKGMVEAGEIIERVERGPEAMTGAEVDGLLYLPKRAHGEPIRCVADPGAERRVGGISSASRRTDARRRRNGAGAGQDGGAAVRHAIDDESDSADVGTAGGRRRPGAPRAGASPDGTPAPGPGRCRCLRTYYYPVAPETRQEPPY